MAGQTVSNGQKVILNLNLDEVKNLKFQGKEVLIPLITEIKKELEYPEIKIRQIEIVVEVPKYEYFTLMLPKIEWFTLKLPKFEFFKWDLFEMIKKPFDILFPVKKDMPYNNPIPNDVLYDNPIPKDRPYPEPKPVPKEFIDLQPRKQVYIVPEIMTKKEETKQ